MQQPVCNRLRKWGAANVLTIPAETFRRLAWRSGDLLAIREVGDKLIVERVRLDNVAVMRNGEATERPA